MGRPVEVEIVPRAHAILSASSAERWLVCTPSARIEEAVQDEESHYASDGTAAHAFAEARLRWMLGDITKEEYLAAYEATRKLYAEQIDDWVVSDWEAINSYVRYVLDEHKRLGGQIYIEARVDYSKYAESGFGTSDALLVSLDKGIVKSIDLKFGKGVAVSAVGNVQAKLYVLGGFLKLSEADQAKITTVEWAIHQPRLDYVGEDTETLAELIDWAENTVAPAAKLAWEGKGKLVPTAKGCRFCKVAATCRARAAENVLIARRDFDMSIDLDEYTMGPDEIAKILPNLEQWFQWAKKLEAQALVQVRDKGVEIPGYKLVRGRSNRAYIPGKDIAAELKELGVPEATIYAEPAVRSVAQMEKAIGKTKFAPIEQKLVHKPLGTPALVPETDPRPRVDATEEAKSDFGIDKQ